MSLSKALAILFQFALVVILGTIVLVKWTVILVRLIWQLLARKKAQ